MMKEKSESKAAQLCPTLRDPRDCSTRLLCPWDFLGKNTGVGCHCLQLNITPLAEKKGHRLQLLPKKVWMEVDSRKCEHYWIKNWVKLVSVVIYFENPKIKEHVYNYAQKICRCFHSFNCLTEIGGNPKALNIRRSGIYEGIKCWLYTSQLFWKIKYVSTKLM